MIPFNVPPYAGPEMECLEKAAKINRKICGDGEFTKKVSAWLEERTQASRVFLTTSCTSALEMAAHLSGIGEGEEVIMPSYTFVSTADCFVLRHAVPVFVDIRPDTMNIDEQKIEDAITDKTRVIAVVHYAGVACEMDTILDIARRHHLMVIEDNAQGCPPTRDIRSEPSEILAACPSMRRRTTAWERAAPCRCGIRTGSRMRRSSGKRGRTGASSSAGRSTSIRG